MTDGVLRTESIHDPENVYYWRRLASNLRGRAYGISEKVRDDASERQWVQAVVVVWGDFVQGVVESDRVFYVHGDQLVAWLRSRPPAALELQLA